MSSSRDPFFDNAKLLLMLTVISGHLLNTGRLRDPLVFDVYNTIYFFHVPAFAFISGIFAKPIQGWTDVRRLAGRLLAPLLILQALYTVFMVARGEQTLGPDVLSYPQFSLWYLVSLFCWMLMARGLNRLSSVTALSLALVLGIASGMIPALGTRFSASRTFVFFPFFLLGSRLTPTHLLSLRRLRAPAATVLGVLGLTLFLFYVEHWVPENVEEWLLGSSSYADIGVSTINGVIVRTLLYPLSVLAMLAFLALVPGRRRFYTSVGSRTLAIFLFHGFVVKVIHGHHLLQQPSPRWSLLISPALAAVTVGLLGNPFAARLLDVHGWLGHLRRPWQRQRRPAAAQSEGLGRIGTGWGALEGRGQNPDRASRHGSP